MVSTQKTGLMALLTLGALFSSANSFCASDNSFDWPTARYYTGAAIAGAVAPMVTVTPRVLISAAIRARDVGGLMCIPPLVNYALSRNFNATSEQKTSAQFIRGTSCALTVGAFIGKIPTNTPYARTLKLGLMIVYGTLAGLLPEMS